MSKNLLWLKELSIDTKLKESRHRRTRFKRTYLDLVIAKMPHHDDKIEGESFLQRPDPCIHYPLLTIRRNIVSPP